ncbi:hypothetical protein FIV06_15810 [Labrenzia sp. THAF191b]|uniref:hypothetical protein n=1 Tax=unclassified Labrenzia TaxID=2648686 RepID=UPI0012680AEB|nr:MULTISPECIES: hypothetical protein [unclassified Labrenzia]QFS98894.1 hypothetical protein FIV06_15810 [Labrenzia sp. THAF191b]QFT05208.1 hypothetical protein FIV05_15805 [Labrenzia sp. THAF191a]QFT16752.1 hypothetical protein FIV03_15820 [Labrenzia sp. THAF187b]
MTTAYPVERSARISNAMAFNGVDDTFGPFTFKIIYPLDVVVEIRDIGEDFWQLTADVTVIKGPDTADYFTIQFDAVHPDTKEFRVLGARVHERSISLSKGTGLNMEALARVHAEIAFTLQEIRRDLGRALLVPSVSAGGQVADVPGGHFLKRTADGNWGDGGDVDDIAGAQENAAIAAQAAVEAAASAAAAEGVGASVAVWPSGTTRTMKQRATDTYCILDAPGNPDPTGVNDSSAALKAMIAGGVQCELTKGDFVTTEPLLFKTTGQKVVGQGRGYGYGRADYFARDFQPMSRVIAAGTFAKRILTRRKHRASGADLKDDPMSAAIEIHADGIGFQDWLLWLNCDYTDLSHTNLGDNIDIGVLRTGRPGFNTVNFGIIGHFRKTRLLQEYTRALNLPELLDPDGAALPKGASGETFAGGDGWSHHNFLSWGGFSGFTEYGPLHPGGDYYDEATGLVPDERGASGDSDGRFTGRCAIYVAHQSGRRMVDPTGFGAALTRNNMEAEPDFSPAAVDIDGWASNAGSTTTGRGQVRNINFGTMRVSSSAAFRVRLRDCDQVHFSGITWIESGDYPSTLLSWQDTSGDDINVNDYTNVTYGHIATDQAKTGVVWVNDIVGGLNQSWVHNKQNLRASDAYGRELMQALWGRGDTSIPFPSGMRCLDHVYDDGPASEYGGRITESFRPFAYLLDRSSGKAAGFRYDTGIFRYSYGAHTSGLELPNVGFEHNENRFDFRQPVKLPVYSVATLPAAADAGAGANVWCTNGRAGQPCVAVSTGSGWFVVGSYAAVSAT